MQVLSVLVSQSCLTLCDSMDCISPGSSFLGILQARILDGSHALLQEILLTQGSNPGLLCCRQILYRLSHQRNPCRSSVSSVTQSCPTLCDPMDCSMPGFPVHHQLLELAQTHVYQVGDAIQSILSSTIPFSSSFQPFPVSGSEKAMAPHSSTLAWKIPWMEEPGGLQSLGLLRVGHN